VVAVNGLTAKWARQECTGKSTVIAGAGVWPLLAILAASASGDALTELEAAAGVSGADGFEAAQAVLRLLSNSPDVSLALGTWVQAGLPISAEWQQAMPSGTWGQFVGDERDQERLDKWADQQTRGLIPRMPMAVGRETLILIATACLVRTRWLVGFEVETFELHAESGPWADRSNIPVLWRQSTDVDDLLIADRQGAGQLTLAEVRGKNGISVFLVTADDAAKPGDVVTDAISVIGDPSVCRKGSSLVAGDSAPGVEVELVLSETPKPTLSLTTVPFQLEASHDLLQHAALFGLVSAIDPSHGHFPRISPVPLAISRAMQTVTAAFSPDGFEAAAVTVVDIMFGAKDPWPKDHRLNIKVRFDRPFGFVAVHTPSRLVLMAGWVSDPQLITPGDPPNRWPPFSRRQPQG
jgi:serine protease inhibitor